MSLKPWEAPNCFDTINRWLEHYVSEMHKSEQIAGKMIAQGVSLIFQGETPEMIVEEMASYMGYENRSFFLQYIHSEKYQEQDQISFIEEWKKQNLTKECFSQNTTLLESFISMDDIIIQLVLRQLSFEEIIHVLQGSSGKVCERILNNLSVGTAYTLLQKLSEAEPDEKQIVQAQEKIVGIIEYIKSTIIDQKT